nr:ParB/Srx family N-terminal domain-containing protein [Castellaniella sp.]
MALPPLEEEGGASLRDGFRAERESLCARHGDYPDGHCRSEDHPVVLARLPFNKLVLSQSNVRRVKAGVSIDDLAASIARRGLIQSLSVQPVVDADGVETGMFEVPAGGRRFRALELLVKQKRLAKIPAP